MNGADVGSNDTIVTNTPDMMASHHLPPRPRPRRFPAISLSLYSGCRVEALDEAARSVSMRSCEKPRRPSTTWSLDVAALVARGPLGAFAGTAVVLAEAEDA